MAKKTKVPLTYTSEGVDKPVTGQLMIWNGNEWVPVNSETNPLQGMFVLSHITLGNQCVLRVVSNALCIYQKTGSTEVLRARIMLTTGDIEGFSTV